MSSKVFSELTVVLNQMMIAFAVLGDQNGVGAKKSDADAVDYRVALH